MIIVPCLKVYMHLCSHIVAVAEDNGELQSFIENAGYLTPNLTSIAYEGLSSSSGRKGGRPKRKRKAAPIVETTSIRPCLQKCISPLTTTRSSTSNYHTYLYQFS